MDGSRPSAAGVFAGINIPWSNLLWAVVIAVVTIIVSIVVRHLILRYSRRQQPEQGATWYSLSWLVTYVLLFVGLVLAFSALGVPLNQFALIAGAIGVGLGFGLQSLFANFIAGIVLLLDKSLQVGDFVELESGVTGEVRDITMRATTIVTNDNIDILVPNSEFVSGRVVNWTHREVLRRVRVPFSVAYGTDKEAVKAAALEAAAAVPFTLELDGPKRPRVWLTEFGTSSLNYELVIWINPDATKQPGAVTAAYNWALHSALEAHDLSIPFPQRDLHVRSLFGLSGQDARAAVGMSEPQGGPYRDAAPRERSADPESNDAIDEVNAEETAATDRPRRPRRGRETP